MLPGVTNIILDGAMGVAGASATGQFAAVGVASNFGDGIKTFTGPSQVEESIGDGPLRDLLVSALSIAKTTVYAIALEGTIHGECETKTPVKAGTGTVTVDPTSVPRNEYDIEVEILAAGVLNAATFRCTIDGLAGREIIVPDGDGKYEIPGTGITLVFAPGARQFEKGDKFFFAATAPQATNGEILAAVDEIINAKKSIEWIAVAGISSAPLWAALATKAEGAAEVYQYLFFVAQTRYKNDDEYVNALTGAERGSVASVRLQVVAGWIEESDANGQLDIRNAIGVYCGKLAKLKEHQGPDAVRYGGISAATAIKPDGLNDGHIEALKNAGYVTVRKHIGLTGIYITSGEMMSETGSDYTLVERRRVMDKACRQVREAQMFFVNDTVTVGADGSPEGIDMLVAQSLSPLKTMVTDGQISNAEIVVPEWQNILSTNKIRMKVRIVPLGKMVWIENEIAYANPALEA